jgi:Flp pilus assembly protein TadG
LSRGCVRRLSDRLGGLRRETSGAAALEFALIGGLLFMLVIGTIELGRVLHERSAVERALSEAVRAVHLDPDMTGAQIKDRVEALLDDRMEVQVCIRPVDGTSTAQIQILFPVEMAVPMLPKRSITMRVGTLAPRIKEEEDLLDTCGAELASN